MFYALICRPMRDHIPALTGVKEERGDNPAKLSDGSRRLSSDLLADKRKVATRLEPANDHRPPLLPPSVHVDTSRFPSSPGKHPVGFHADPAGPLLVDPAGPGRDGAGPSTQARLHAAGDQGEGGEAS